MRSSREITGSHAPRVRLRGSASLCIGVLATIGAVHCGQYTITTTARVVDPHLVSVEAAPPDAQRILPAGTAAASAPIPGADAEVIRSADGALTFEYDRPFGVSCVPLNGGGVFTLRGQRCSGRVLPDANMFRAQYAYNRPPGFSVTMSTPWSNVIEIRERQSLDRIAGFIWLVLGSAAVVAGSRLAVLAFDDPEAARHLVPVPGFVIPALIGVGGAMLSAGVFYAFFPERERIVFSRF